MTDVLTKRQRSYNMSRIKCKNTKPELVLRGYIHKHNLTGYRLHSSLPGKPDLVFPKYKLAVFVDGCFWHKCKKCFVMPETNKTFWKNKIERNVKRDKEINQKLRKEGYDVLRIPEHRVRDDLNNCYTKIFNILQKKGFKNGTA